MQTAVCLKWGVSVKGMMMVCNLQMSKEDRGAWGATAREVVKSWT